MFDTGLYKSVAKKQLSGRFAVPLLATATVLVVFVALNGNFLAEQLAKIKDFPTLWEISRSNGKFFLKLNFVSLEKHSSIILWALSYTVQGVICMAYAYLCIALSHTTQKVNFGVFLDGFRLYAKGITCFFWRFLWITLWKLLFVIPGIVKHYAYSQMFFIMAEHPGVSARKAMKISMAITRGNKADLFLMDLSFLLWYALIPLTGGIMALYVLPYRTMAFTNAYHALLEKALKNGTITQEDLCQNVRTYI